MTLTDELAQALRQAHETIEFMVRDPEAGDPQRSLMQINAALAKYDAKQQTASISDVINSVVKDSLTTDPVAWRDPTNIDPGQSVTFEKSTAEKWPHIYRQPLYVRPPSSIPSECWRQAIREVRMGGLEIMGLVESIEARARGLVKVPK